MATALLRTVSCSRNDPQMCQLHRSSLSLLFFAWLDFMCAEIKHLWQIYIHVSYRRMTALDSHTDCYFKPTVDRWTSMQKLSLAFNRRVLLSSLLIIQTIRKQLKRNELIVSYRSPAQPGYEPASVVAVEEVAWRALHSSHLIFETSRDVVKPQPANPATSAKPQ